MPYINTKVSIPLDNEKKQILKEKLGERFHMTVWIQGEGISLIHLIMQWRNLF